MPYKFKIVRTSRSSKVEPLPDLITRCIVPDSQGLGLSPIAVEWCFSTFPVRQGGEEKRALRSNVSVAVLGWLLKNLKFYCWGSSGSSGRVRGARNMKFMWPLLAAIFFITYFHRAGGGGGSWPLSPPGSATVGNCFVKKFTNFDWVTYHRLHNLHMPTSLPNPDIHWSKRRKKLVSEQKLANRVPPKITKGNRKFIWASWNSIHLIYLINLK